MKVFLAMLLLLALRPSCAQAGQVGNAAPDFSLQDVSGKTFTLQQFKGKVLFLDFWAPWCDPCREELPSLDALYRKYGGDGLAVVGIDIDPSEKLVSEFLQKVPVSFTVLVDRKGALRKEYRIRTLPTAYIIGKDGVVRYMRMGYGKEYVQMYEKEIAELLKQP